MKIAKEVKNLVNESNEVASKKYPDLIKISKIKEVVAEVETFNNVMVTKKEGQNLVIYYVKGTNFALDGIKDLLTKKGIPFNDKMRGVIQLVADKEIDEAMTKKEHMDWYNKVFYPTLKEIAKGDFDPMMVQADGDGKFKVFTKMYKSGGVTSIKKAFEQLGIEIVEVQPNASSYRGYVVGKSDKFKIGEGLCKEAKIDKKQALIDFIKSQTNYDITPFISDDSHKKFLSVRLEEMPDIAQRRIKSLAHSYDKQKFSVQDNGGLGKALMYGKTLTESMSDSDVLREIIQDLIDNGNDPEKFDKFKELVFAELKRQKIKTKFDGHDIADELGDLGESLNKKDLSALIEEIVASYTKEEMAEFKDFQDFFDSEDVRNAYEEDWEDEKDYWEDYLKEVWKMYKAGKLNDQLG